ncbi:MAG: PIN domain-containing protein [Candidatus Pacearchaeota archaeon]|jgi:predicted nucleic acid-binding protein
MKLIIDANILFSALIKEQGITRKLILNDKLILISPDFIIEEFLEHLEELENKTGVKTEILKEKIKELLRLSNIKLISEKNYINSIKQAEKISPDIGDIPYFAIALKFNIPIWSNDKLLKSQDKVKIYSTEELINELNL